MRILIFSGSARQGNYTAHVAEFVREFVSKKPDVQVELVSPQTLHLNFENEGTSANYPELRQQVTAADAFIIVAPEYNHGYSGSLKYMLDLNLKEYTHKPVAFVGVSSGQFGGARMIEHLTSIVRKMGLVATASDVNVGYDEKEIIDGKFVDPAKWEKRLDRLFTELSWMSQTLKYGREHI